MNNFDLRKYLAKNKLLKEEIDFPELEDEFEGAMDAMVVEPEEYLQDIIDASAEEIVSDDYYEIMNAVEQGVYSEDEAVKLAKAWAKEKLSNLSEGKLLNEAFYPEFEGETNDKINNIAVAVVDELEPKLDNASSGILKGMDYYVGSDGIDNEEVEQGFTKWFVDLVKYLNQNNNKVTISSVKQDGKVFTPAITLKYLDNGKEDISWEVEGKLNENYTPGSGWTKDFDYDGMLNLALTLDADSSMDLLLKVSSDLEDVNYHRENSYLTDAIDAIKAGDRAEAKIAINRFRKEIKKNINENTIKERKESKIQTKMKKSELKEMIKTAMLNEYSDDYTNEQEEVDVEDNEKVDVDIEKDVEVDDESVETDIDVKGSMPGENADEIAVQSLLMKAQEEAEKLGDEKLTDQIGNTITYFTRAHVATVDKTLNEAVDLKSLMNGDKVNNDALVVMSRSYKDEEDARKHAMRPKAIVDDSENGGPGARRMKFADLAGGPDRLMKIDDGKVEDIRLFSDWDSMNEETDYDNTDAVSGDINVTNDNPAADAEIGLALNEEVARFKKLAGIIK